MNYLTYNSEIATYHELLFESQNMIIFNDVL